MTLCKIDGGIAAPVDCQQDVVIAGVNDRLILLNFDDIESTTRDAGNPLLITALTMAAATQGYAFEGQRNSNVPSFELVKQAFSIAYDHTVVFKGFSTSAATKKILSDLAKSKVVAVVENNDKTFEVFGLDTGLLVDAMVRDATDSATQGAFDITLKTDENVKEGRMPVTWEDTDFATTKVLVDGLLTP